MKGIKAQLKEELKAMGIRKIPKPGYGECPLGQCKTVELMQAYEEAKRK